MDQLHKRNKLVYNNENFRGIGITEKSNETRRDRWGESTTYYQTVHDPSKSPGPDTIHPYVLKLLLTWFEILIVAIKVVSTKFSHELNH